MGHAQPQTSFDEMSPAEQILHVQDLWDRIADEPERIPVSEAQRTELNRRLDEHRANPDDVVSWDALKNRLRQKS